MNEDGEVIEAALTTSDMAAVTKFGMAALVQLILGCQGQIYFR